MNWMVFIKKKVHPEFIKLLGIYSTIAEARFIRDVYRRSSSIQNIIVKIERTDHPAGKSKIPAYLEHLEKLEHEEAKKVSHKPIIRRT